MEITLGDVFDAMEKDGYQKIQTGGYIAFSEGSENDYYGDWDFSKIVGACAFGQAALNLRTQPAALHRAMLIAGEAIFFSEINPFRSLVTDNDYTEMTVPEIARKYREIAKDHLDHVINV